MTSLHVCADKQEKKEMKKKKEGLLPASQTARLPAVARLTRWGSPAASDFRVSAGELLLERGECDFSTFPSD